MAAAKVNVSIWMQVLQSGGAAREQLWQEGFSQLRLPFPLSPVSKLQAMLGSTAVGVGSRCLKAFRMPLRWVCFSASWGKSPHFFVREKLDHRWLYSTNPGPTGLELKVHPLSSPSPCPPPKTALDSELFSVSSLLKTPIQFFDLTSRWGSANGSSVTAPNCLQIVSWEETGLCLLCSENWVGLAPLQLSLAVRTEEATARSSSLEPDSLPSSPRRAKDSEF